MAMEDSRDRLQDVLLRHVLADKYPSATMLDLLERQLTPERREELVEVLLDKIEDERYPSMDLIRRVGWLMAG